MEDLQAEYDQSQADLQLAFKRIADLQAAIEDDFHDGSELGDDSDDLDRCVFLDVSDSSRSVYQL